MSLVGQSGDMAQLPAPLRALIGLVATVTQDGHELSDKTVELSVQAVSNALALSLRAQQHYAALTVRGDELLAQMRGGPPDDAPDWARFDDEEPLASDAATGAPPNADLRTGESSVTNSSPDDQPAPGATAAGGHRTSSPAAADSPSAQTVSSAKTARRPTAATKATQSATTAPATKSAQASKGTAVRKPAKPAKAAKAAAPTAAPKPAARVAQTDAGSAAVRPARRVRPSGAKTISAPRNGRLSAFDQTTDHGDATATWERPDAVDGTSD
jgi:hypothetical protein